MNSIDLEVKNEIKRFVNSGKNEYSIDKNLTNGIYIFTIKNNTMSFSKKVAIHSL